MKVFFLLITCLFRYLFKQCTKTHKNPPSYFVFITFFLVFGLNVQVMQEFLLITKQTAEGIKDRADTVMKTVSKMTKCREVLLATGHLIFMKFKYNLILNKSVPSPPYSRHFQPSILYFFIAITTFLFCSSCSQCFDSLTKNVQ